MREGPLPKLLRPREPLLLPILPPIKLKEGMTLGTQNAVVRAILPGGIVLVEKISNVYGQEEFFETVIPIVGR